MDARDSTDSEMKRPCQYKEIKKGVSMKVVDYFSYLEERQKLIKSDGAKQGAEWQISMLDVDEVVYLLSYEIKKKLLLH